jgi:cyclopropane-fatty-acyl-phospholipid synthase
MLSRKIVKYVCGYVGSKTKTPFKIRFSDHTEYESKPGNIPAFTIIFRRAVAERAVLIFNEVGFAEHYFRQNIDIEGDITQIAIVDGEFGKSIGSNNLIRNPINVIRNWWHELMHSNRSIGQAKKNAIVHYGRDTGMFRQYLDSTMTYTCAYWKNGTTTLEQAQKDKLEHVCRKLRLKPGETLVDIGSGWGSMLFHAYEHYGVLGTNVSPTPDQNKAMAAEIKRRGLEGKIHIQEADFRETKGIFDKYVSMGVYEHAGYYQLEDWIKATANCLKDGGIGVLHFIGTVDYKFAYTGFFIRHYIFPGGHHPGLAKTLELMNKYGLEILDVENLRRHYAPTLRAWAVNFDNNWQKIHALDPQKHNEYFRRMWRFFLYGCAGTFIDEHSPTGLFQILFSKGKTKTYPMTRDFLYPSGVHIPAARSGRS